MLDPYAIGYLAFQHGEPRPSLGRNTATGQVNEQDLVKVMAWEDAMKDEIRVSPKLEPSVAQFLVSGSSR